LKVQLLEFLFRRVSTDCDNK
jgi:hypothetical protein